VFSSGYGYGGYSYGFGHNGYLHHGFGYGSGYYGGGSLNVEVKLILDFIDHESNNVNWRGLYKDRIDESGILVMTVDNISKAVKKILKEFPPDQKTITDRSFSNTEVEFVSLTTLAESLDSATQRGGLCEYY